VEAFDILDGEPSVRRVDIAHALECIRKRPIRFSNLVEPPHNAVESFPKIAHETKPPTGAHPASSGDVDHTQPFIARDVVKLGRCAVQKLRTKLHRHAERFRPHRPHPTTDAITGFEHNDIHAVFG
jgi:hypothetical protein